MERLGERLRAVRKARGLTMVDLARAAGCSQAYLSDLENEKRPPSRSMLVAIATKLSVSERWLETGEGPRDMGGTVEEVPPGLRLMSSAMRERYMRDIRTMEALENPAPLVEMLDAITTWWAEAGADERTWLAVQLRKAAPEVFEKVARYTQEVSRALARPPDLRRPSPDDAGQWTREEAGLGPSPDDTFRDPVTPAQRSLLAVADQLHDIGKLCVPQSIFGEAAWLALEPNLQRAVIHHMKRFETVLGDPVGAVKVEPATAADLGALIASLQQLNGVTPEFAHWLGERFRRVAIGAQSSRELAPGRTREASNQVTKRKST